MTLRVLVSCPNMLQRIDTYRPLLENAGVKVDAPRVLQQLNEAELLEIIDKYDGVIAGDDELTANVIAVGARSRLRVISKWGVGTDNIDRDAAREHGVAVTNTPGAFGEEVADVAVGYVIMLARQLHQIDAAVRSGQWLKPLGTSLRGQTLGAVGLGSIGGALIKRVTAMGMNVIGTDPSEDATVRAKAQGAAVDALDAVVSRSDFLVLCCPLTDATHHLLGASRLTSMKPGAYLINVSRGPLVDQAALVGALESGHLAGAALDVFEEEPLRPGEPICSFAQVILGSHNGSNTAEAVDRVSRWAVSNLLREFDLGDG